MIFEKFWKNSLKSPFLIKNQYFHQNWFFTYFFLFSWHCWVKCIEICKKLLSQWLTIFQSKIYAIFKICNFLHVWNCPSDRSPCHTLTYHYFAKNGVFFEISTQSDQLTDGRTEALIELKLKLKAKRIQHWEFHHERDTSLIG